MNYSLPFGEEPESGYEVPAQAKAMAERVKETEALLSSGELKLLSVFS